MKIIAAVAVAAAFSATSAGAQQIMLGAPPMPLVQQPGPFMQQPPVGLMQQSMPLVQQPMPLIQQPPMQQPGMLMVQQPMSSGLAAGEPPIRVSNTFRTSVPASETGSMSDEKAQETVRRSLYGMVAGECALLSEAFKADCRLNSFTVQALPAAAPGTLTATAIYELKPKDGGSAR